jgi:hypothetical protein
MIIATPINVIEFRISRRGIRKYDVRPHSSEQLVQKTEEFRIISDMRIGARASTTPIVAQANIEILMIQCAANILKYSICFV